jgi:hypothetical protein
MKIERFDVTLANGQTPDEIIEQWLGKPDVIGVGCFSRGHNWLRRLLGWDRRLRITVWRNADYVDRLGRTVHELPRRREDK